MAPAIPSPPLLPGPLSFSLSLLLLLPLLLLLRVGRRKAESIQNLMLFMCVGEIVQNHVVLFAFVIASVVRNVSY